MDYFRSLGTTLLNQTGITLPFTLGEKVNSFEGKTIWSLHDGIRKEDSSPISILVFDANIPAPRSTSDRRNLLPIAKNGLKKMRSTRHPDILKFIDVHETETQIYIMTERVKPLDTVFSDGMKVEDDYIVWGLQRITNALAFLNSQASSIHGNVRSESVFVTESGEWRLGGLELLSSTKDTGITSDGIVWNFGGLLPNSNTFVSPEIRKQGWSILKETDANVADSYALALLIHTLFNPTHPLPPTSQPPHPPPQPSSRGSIPNSIFPAFKRMLNPNPRTRMSTAAFLEEGMKLGSGFFKVNRLVVVCEGLDGFALASEGERAAFLHAIQNSIASFPPQFLTYKVLPSLLHSLSLSTTSASALLPIVLQLGRVVPPSDYSKMVLEPVVKLYASPDRGTRMALLEGLSDYGDKLDQRLVVDKVWPHLITGFADSVAVIREATIKAIPIIAPKLSERLLNNDLLRHLAKMQLDPEPSIRTNTCILLGRLAKQLGPNTKKKVLVPAFARSLKDTFVHARVAGLMALMATIEVYDREDLAVRVIPNMSFALVDKEKLVRDQAFLAVNIFVKKLEGMVASMAETAETNGAVSSAGGVGPTTTATSANASAGGMVNTAGAAAGALAGWAFASLGSKLAASEEHSAMNAPSSSNDPSIPGSFSSAAPAYVAPAMNFNPSASSASASNSNPHSSFGQAQSSAASASRTPSKTGAMKMGGVKKHNVPDFLLEETLAAEEDDMAKQWGGDNLIDVEADEDDWSAFEAAPTPLYPPEEPTYNLSTSKPKTTNGSSAKPKPAVPSANIDDVDPWADPEPTPAPKPVATAPKPKPVVKKAPVPAPAPPTPPPVVEEPAVVNLAGLSKEEKDAEMARRREERKARIAAMKDKKGKA